MYVNLTNATATDNAEVSVECSIADGLWVEKGDHLVTCTATDSSGNVDECSYVLAVAGMCLVVNFFITNDTQMVYVIT